MESSPAVHHDVQQQVRRYITVFVALLCLTILTVTISQLHLAVPLAIAAALFIAVIKGSLVASYFMHLISERKAIYAMLILTVIFFAALMALPLFAHSDPIVYRNVP